MRKEDPNAYNLAWATNQIYHLAHSFLPHPFCIFFDVHNPCSLRAPTPDILEALSENQAWLAMC